ncbi:peptidoglycan endopeptidase [bacterium]|nr:MAG: peptidoglycan endopeptidase [bacterium]
MVLRLLLIAGALVCALATPALAAPRAHLVQPGESLYSIAHQANISPENLARYNDLEGDRAGALRPGQRLLLQEDTSAPARVATAPVEGADVSQWTDDAPTTSKRSSADHTDGLVGKFFARSAALAREVSHAALSFIGVPYAWGGTTASGFDCSGYVQHVFAMIGVHLPRTADAQYLVGQHVASGHLQAGDLVFFQTYAPGASHVGIYLGDGRFAHSSSHGVMVSSLSESYWANRYLGAKRVAASHSFHS